MSDPRSPLAPLRRAVRASGETQAELCRLLGISQKHMSVFMNGKGGLSEQLAADLCRILHLHPVVMTQEQWLEWTADYTANEES